MSSPSDGFVMPQAACEPECATVQCDECGFSWDATPTSLFTLLEGVAPLFARTLEAVDDQTVRHRPSPSVWSILEYTAHTRDAIGWYSDRIGLVIARDRPQLTAFDWDAACLDRRYNEEDAGHALAELRAASAALATRLRGLDTGAWARIAIGSDGDERTVLVLARRAGHEAAHHLHDVEMIASQLAVPPS